MSVPSRNNSRPRGSTRKGEHTKRKRSVLNSAEFIPSVRVVKRVREGDGATKEFVTGVSRVVRNERKGKKVSGKFATPHHTHLSSEVLGQQPLAAQIKKYSPREEQMKKVAIALRNVLMVLYQEDPTLMTVNLGDVTTNTRGKREKIVITPEKGTQERERHISRLTVAQELPGHMRINPDYLFGDADIVIASSEQTITEDDMDIIVPSIEEIKPTTLTMDTIVELHTGVGRAHKQEFPVLLT